MSQTFSVSSANHSASQTALGDLTKSFNTAVISSRDQSGRELSSELAELVRSAPFNSILHAVRSFAETAGLTEQEASQKIIETFRKVDAIWGQYLLQEGLDRLKT